MHKDDLQLYLDAGMVLLETEGKVPTEQNWTSKTFSPTPTPKMLASKTFGVKLTDDLLVIDDDPRNYKGGVNSLDLLQQHIGCSLFETSKFIVQTGSGGHHFYFKKPANLKVQENITLYPGVEFKSTGRQVIGAGSIHPDTQKPYKIYFTSESPKNITPAPAKLLEIIAKKSIPEIKKGLTRYTDNDFDVRRCKERLEEVKPAIEGENGDNHTFYVCCLGHDFGLSPEAFLPLLRTWNERCEPPWDDAELQTKLYNAYRYAQNGLGHKSFEMDFPEIAKAYDVEPHKTSEDEKKHLRELESSIECYDKSKRPKPTFRNASLLLEHHPKLLDVFWFNEFLARPVIRKSTPWNEMLWGDGRNIDDDDVVQLKYFLAAKCKVEFPTQTLWDALRQVAYKKRFHPVRAFLKSLTWDKTPRIGRWLTTYLGAEDNPYIQAIGKKFLVGAVARIMEPGIKFDFMLHLEGNQGIGKSTTCRMLFEPWFTDANVDITDKDGVLLLQGNWGIEFGETAAFRRVEMEHQKSFITRSTDMIRAPYDRTTKEYPRQQVFISTTNYAVYGDETGNRRWWPVKVIQLQMDKLAADRDQLWAEAVHWYHLGEKLFLDTPQLVKMAEAEQLLRLDEDGWSDRILDFLVGRGEFKTPQTEVTVDSIWTGALSRTSGSLSRGDQLRISRVLRTHGWERKTKRDEFGNFQKTYVKGERV